MFKDHTLYEEKNKENLLQRSEWQMVILGRFMGDIYQLMDIFVKVTFSKCLFYF